MPKYDFNKVMLFYHRQNILFASCTVIYGFKVSNRPSRISSAQSICLLHFFLVISYHSHLN